MILCLGTTPAVQRVMRFRRLALGAVNRAAVTLDGIGGKSFNVAKVLHALGERALVVAFLGGERGALLRALLAERGIELDCVEVGASTRQCVTVVDESSGEVTELVEESRPVARANYDSLMETVRRRVGQCRAVVMSGTLAPGGGEDFYAQCVGAARAGGVVAVVDAQGPALAHALEAAPHVVKPNRIELAATLRRDLPDEAAVCDAMRELRERGARRVVVTAGPGPTLAYDGRTFWRITAPPVTAVNPIGAGDAFTAGMVQGLLRGAGLDEACRRGSAAGSASALKLMVAEVDGADVERLLPAVTVERI